MAPLPCGQLSTGVANIRLLSNEEALHFQDKGSSLNDSFGCCSFLCKYLAGNMNRKMLRLLFMAEAAFMQSTECIYSAHYTGVGFGLHFRRGSPVII